MLRLIASLILSLLANAIGLLAAAYLLEDFSIDGLAFITAVAIFTLATFILGPLITKIAIQSANYLMGGIALVTTLVGLIITDLVSDGVSINGINTWVLATLIIWIFSIIGSLVLPLFLFKKTLEKAKENK